MEASREEEGRGRKAGGLCPKMRGSMSGWEHCGGHGDCKSRDRAGGGVTDAADSSERGEPLAT